MRRKKWPSWEDYKQLVKAGYQFAFKSDGCSSVPDFNFTECCVEHDYHYTAHDVSRKEADLILKRCIASKGFHLLPSIYYWGVRIFGARHYRRLKNEVSHSEPSS